MIENVQQCSLLHGYAIPHNDIFLTDIVCYDRLIFSQIYTPKQSPGHATADIYSLHPDLSTVYSLTKPPRRSREDQGQIYLSSRRRHPLEKAGFRLWTRRRSEIK